MAICMAKSFHVKLLDMADDIRAFIAAKDRPPMQHYQPFNSAYDAV